MKKLLKNYLSIAHNFPGHKDVFQQKTAFFEKIWVKTQKSRPAPANRAAKGKLMKMIYQRFAVSLYRPS